MRSFDESFPLEYDSPAFLPLGLMDEEENDSEMDSEYWEPMNLVEIEEELSASLESMSPSELDEFSDWLVESGNEKYLETFLGILESQLVKQYNLDVAEEQEIVDVLTDIESLETELNAAEEAAGLQQYQYPMSGVYNYEDSYYDDWGAPAYWVYQQQPSYQFVDPFALQSLVSKPTFLAREVDPVAMKRYVYI